MEHTKFAGQVINSKVIVVAEQDGEFYTVPHVSELKGKALKPVTITKDSDFRYLTAHEVSCFMKGLDINGNKVKTPAEEMAEHKARAEAFFQTPDGQEVYKKMKEAGLA